MLRQTIERRLPANGAAILPDLVTRDQWLRRLHAASGAARWVDRLERELLMTRAARAASERLGEVGAPFAIRPAIVAAMLDFYDELRRRQRTVRRFARTLFDELRVERNTDRGSESLIRQTVLLGFAFLAYQRELRAAGGVDEHTLRATLLAGQPELPFDHVVVAVADHPADLRGLWPSDFELLSRLTSIQRLDVVVTDEIHDVGFRDRIEHELPGIEETRAGERHTESPPPPPVRISRDREDELRDVVRAIRAQAADGRLDESTAIVFHRPLPYLYLAPQIFAAGGVPLEIWDALPLAAEPYAAAFDLLLSAAQAGCSAETVLPLLRSPFARVAIDDVAIEPKDVGALTAILAAQRATGDAETFLAEVNTFAATSASRRGPDAIGAARAARAAATLQQLLRPFREAASAAEQIATLSATLRTIEPPLTDATDSVELHRQARVSVLSALDELTDACRRATEPTRDPDELAAWLRHAIELRTCAPLQRTTAPGIPLVDVMAARFADVDHVHLIGLVDTDWSDGGKRNIFYTSGLLKYLGWPQESDRSRARLASFRDLLSLGRQTTTLHAFQLDGDTVVGPAPVADVVGPSREITADDRADEYRFPDEWLSDDSVEVRVLADIVPAQRWVGLRAERPSLDSPAYAGQAGPQARRAYRVSRVERYVDCPFKYFAESVLQLPEERPAVAGLNPLERGSLVHALFQRFYAEWQASGRGAITADTLPEALDRFAALTDEVLAPLPEADRLLERTRLRGSIVATGLAERVFQLEADAEEIVLDRLLEVPLAGTFRFPFADDTAPIEVRGKADRIDVLAGRRLRVIDYKLGRMPDVESSLQIGVYAHCAAQWLEGRDGRRHEIAEAMYIAFGDERDVAAPLGDATTPVTSAVQAKAAAFATAIADIERGHFPIRPRRIADCAWCGFAAVCRKEYAAPEERVQGSEFTVRFPDESPGSEGNDGPR